MKGVVIMDDFVMKVYNFILFLVNIIKDLVLNVSGKAQPVEETTAA